MTWVEGFYALSVQVAGDPSEVAEAIVAAASDPSTPVDVLVGDGAEAYVDVVEQTETVEAFHALVAASIESQLGPRPAVRS